MKFCGVVILVIISLRTYSQNLVPDPSFENCSNCLTGAGDIAASIPWTNPTLSTPDYFNACFSIPSTFSVPTNFAGYKNAHTGKAYAGLANISPSAPYYRDYIQVKLTDSLSRGKQYCVSYYVALSNIVQYAVNGFSAYFSNTQIIDTTLGLLPFSAQFNYQGAVITDTANWTLISGQFIANGGELYMIIGNFNTIANTSSTLVNSSAIGINSYYYIDDVYVGTCDTLKPPVIVSSLSVPNIFTPNNDGVNDVFKIQGSNIQALTCSIYDRWGGKVWELKSPLENWDGRNPTGMPCNDGVYYYVLDAAGEDGKTYHKTGFVELVR
jgi:gliding motility-associated-like protein